MYRLMPFVLFSACTNKTNSPDSSVTDSGLSVPTLAAPPEGEGFQLSMTGEVGPFEEVWLCEVYPIPISAITPINWVHYIQNYGMHHFSLSTPGLLSSGDIPYGSYDCNDLYTSSDLMEDAIIFFGGQGDAEGELHLPDGVAAQLPPSIDVVHEIHYVNATDETVQLYSHINAWAIPDSEVIEGIWGGSVRDEHINIPAQSTHSEWSRCVFNQDVEVLFLAAHQHKLGTRFTIAPFDGVNVGETLYENDDWHTPNITQYDTPLVVPAGQGFQFTCEWDNTTDAEINYGLTADDEMCNMAVVHTPMSTSTLCEVVQTSDGVLYTP